MVMPICDIYIFGIIFVLNYLDLAWFAKDFGKFAIRVRDWTACLSSSQRASSESPTLFG